LNARTFISLLLNKNLIWLVQQRIMKEKVILVPTDFSTNGEAAVKYAVRLAEDTNSRLVFLHAFRLLQTIPSMEKSPLIIKEEWNTYTSEKFNELKESFLVDTSARYEFVTEIGFADDSIQSNIKSFNASIIVIGASGEGEGGWTGIYGSTTSSVIDNSTVPVIVVPAITKYAKICNVAFAFDFKPVKNKTQLQSAVNFLGTKGMTFEVLNINDDGYGITERQKQMVERIIQFENIKYQVINDIDVSNTSSTLIPKCFANYDKIRFSYWDSTEI